MVYLGEVVCSKRTPFYDIVRPRVIERLLKGGKEVVLSTYAMITTPQEERFLEAEIARYPSLTVEANDLSIVRFLKGAPFIVGPFINTYNESTLKAFVQQGAKVVSLPAELPRRSIAALGAFGKGMDVPPSLEVQVFGRPPLALSARCYHARMEGVG